ncbi:hypothetical protein QL285_007802 [Trifolium repens]|nr:hypothetical protein QL285_007802 [Trifolium repens]
MFNYPTPSPLWWWLSVYFGYSSLAVQASCSMASEQRVLVFRFGFHHSSSRFFFSGDYCFSWIFFSNSAVVGFFVSTSAII